MSNHQLVIGFFVALLATVAGLVVAIAQARRHRPRGHVAAVGVSAALLLVTLALAETLGQRFDFPPTAFRIHMVCAYTAAGFLLVTLASGALHWRGVILRVAHRAVAILWLATVLAALGTGVWMFAGATAKPPPSGVQAP